MFRHLASLVIVSGLFVGIMALADTTGNECAWFVPYTGPYRLPPPPPHPLEEQVPAPVSGIQWKPGHWQWVGNGYRWHAGQLLRPYEHLCLRS